MYNMHFEEYMSEILENGRNHDESPGPQSLKRRAMVIASLAVPGLVVGVVGYGIGAQQAESRASKAYAKGVTDGAKNCTDSLGAGNLKGLYGLTYSEANLLTSGQNVSIGDINQPLLKALSSPTAKRVELIVLQNNGGIGGEDLGLTSESMVIATELEQASKGFVFVDTTLGVPRTETNQNDAMQVAIEELVCSTAVPDPSAAQPGGN